MRLLLLRSPSCFTITGSYEGSVWALRGQVLRCRISAWSRGRLLLHRVAVLTHRLHSSSSWDDLIGFYIINHKKELLRSLWVQSCKPCTLILG